MTDTDDFTAAIDDLLDLGLTIDQAEDVWRWHVDMAKTEAQTAGGIVILRLLDYLLRGHRDTTLRVRAAGIAWAFGLGHLTGYDSQEECAQAEGVSQQALSRAAEQAKRRLTA